MTNWMIETLVWTGLVIGLVLMLRRPVGRYFGPKAAYALWILPVLRLLMPPLVFPAWLAPSVPEVVQAAPQSGEYTAYTAQLAKNPADQMTAAASDTFALSVSGGTILLTIWLTGAAIFMGLWFTGYFKMRRSLLAESRPVGEAGSVRLVETPAATAPLAFGVIDKVIALPPGFMALHNREQRDFVLAHELAHHSGYDLLANMAAQPLFALHWFNPLSWLGWRALRRDQEAACDARVIAQRSAADKAIYAQTIASFATGPRVSLAATMACPVLGEKSIIHRLRSISMSDISPRRRFAGRALIGASLLALPLAASISYAENIAKMEPVELPPAPTLAMSAPEAPEPPAAPRAPNGEDLSPPVPPAPPSPRTFEREFESIVTDDGRGKVVIIDKASGDTKDKKVTTRLKKVHFTSNGQKMTAEERAELRHEVAEALAESDQALAEVHEERRVAILQMNDAKGQKTKLSVDCKEGKQGKSTNSGGHTTVHLCTSEVYAQALSGLKEARKAIASNSEITGEMRAEVLAALDEKISEWKKK
jgi:bla regulator protein BlaR1